MKKDLKIVVAGSRSFDEQAYLDVMRPNLEKFIKEISDSYTLIIVSGTAPGADQFGEKFAREFNLKIERYPAEWRKNGIYNNAAGYERNEKMAQIGDIIVVFWDGKSKGSQHMIDLAKKYKRKLKIIRFTPT